MNRLFFYLVGMLNYADQGEGEVLVFLHGFCSDMRIWEDFIVPFTEEYRVICLDLPGCGSSPVMTPSLVEWATACWETLRIIGVHKCHLIGHSMGGYVALAMMDAAPEKVVSFISFHSSPLTDNEERKSNRFKQISFIDKYGPKMLVSQIVPALFHSDFEEDKIMPAVSIAEEQSGRGLQAALEAMAKRANRRNLLFSTKMPILFVSGAYDAILPIEEQTEFAASCQNAQIVILENSGHMAMLEEKIKAQEHIERFLANQR